MVKVAGDSSLLDDEEVVEYVEYECRVDDSESLRDDEELD
jgi:hypothetical protein